MQLEQVVAGFGPRADSSPYNTYLLPILTLMLSVLAACTGPTPIPQWFDSIQRMPIRTVDIHGRRIAYLDRGEGPVLMLVHGLGGSIWQWEYQQIPLSETHRVITLDLLGSGLSDKPDIEYRPNEMVEFFRNFMDALGIQRATLIGNSMGAAIVVGMALTHPERVDRLVLISGMPKGVRSKLGSTFIKSAVESRAPIWLAVLANWLAGRWLTESVLKEAVYDPKLLTPAVLERAHQNRKQPGFLPSLIKLARNLPLWEEGFALRLGEIKQKTLVVWGAEDRIFPSDVARELHATIPGSSLAIVPDAGHIPQWEKPEAVNRILLEFLQS